VLVLVDVLVVPLVVVWENPREAAENANAKSKTIPLFMIPPWEYEGMVGTEIFYNRRSHKRNYFTIDDEVTTEEADTLAWFAVFVLITALVLPDTWLAPWMVPVGEVALYAAAPAPDASLNVPEAESPARLAPLAARFPPTTALVFCVAAVSVLLAVIAPIDKPVVLNVDITFRPPTLIVWAALSPDAVPLPV
jgi:hypothetical protein